MSSSPSQRGIGSAPAAASIGQIVADASIPAALAVGHVPHLVALLHRSAAPDHEVQRKAVAILEHCENVPGFVEQMVVRQSQGQ